MSSDAGSAGTPPSPPTPVVRFADILFVDAVLDPNGGNPKGRRVGNPTDIARPIVGRRAGPPTRAGGTKCPGRAG